MCKDAVLFWGPEKGPYLNELPIPSCQNQTPRVCPSQTSLLLASKLLALPTPRCWNIQPTYKFHRLLLARYILYVVMNIMSLMPVKIPNTSVSRKFPVGRMAVRSVELMLVLSLSWCFFMCGARSSAGGAFAQHQKYMQRFGQS